MSDQQETIGNAKELVESLQNMLVARATGSFADDGEFRLLRSQLLENPLVSTRLPSFVRTCRDPSQFWAYIKGVSDNYQGRREHIWSAFRPLLDFLESAATNPGDRGVSETLTRLDAEVVATLWARALERRTSDPEGAITAAKSLLESVCKHILDDMQVQYSDGADLPALYNVAAETLNLAPSQHTEEVFRKILGGCKTVVDGLATLRNRLGDAHGKGRKAVKPSARHAELAVNLAGTMASFMVATWKERGLSGTVHPASDSS
jgi:hypothetical protein